MYVLEGPDQTPRQFEEWPKMVLGQVARAPSHAVLILQDAGSGQEAFDEAGVGKHGPAPTEPQKKAQDAVEAVAAPKAPRKAAKPRRAK